MRRLLVTCLALLLLPLVALASQVRGYQKGEGYQYLQMGTYPQGKAGEEAPVLWRILDVTDGEALLLTEYVLDAQQVIFETDEEVIKARTYRRIESFAQSDLCAWLNEVMLPNILGDTGLSDALVAGENGKLYPLTDKQFLTATFGFGTARYGVSKTRYGKVTPYATARGVYSDRQGNAPYWVAAVKAADDYKLQIVGYDGHLSYGAYTRVNIGLRPAVLLALNRCEITGGDGSIEAPFTVSLAADVPIDAGENKNDNTAPDEALTTDAPPTSDAAMAVTLTSLNAVPLTDAANALDQGDEVQRAKTSEVARMAKGGDASQEPIGQAMTAYTLADSDSVRQTNALPVVVSLIGDVSIGDAYQYRGRGSSLTTAIQSNGMAWAFEKVQDVLGADHLTAANLEVCLTESKDKSGKTFPLIAPPSFAMVLAQGGVDAVNTINNHSFDFGQAGYQDTLEALDQEGIEHFGSIVDGRGNISGKTLVLERGGIRFGFAGYSYPQNETLEAMATQIGELRAAGCDVVIISLHWGRETYMTPKSGQISYAAKIIDMGADAIWGHHPHVLQPVQFYQGKPILFSTGNFIFGTMSKVEPATGIFQLDYVKTEEGARLRTFRVIPCMTQRAPDYQPYVLTEETEMQQVWAFLRAKKTYDGYENLPESFLTTGIVQLDDDGQLIQ